MSYNEIRVYTHLIIKCTVTDKEQHTLGFERECSLQWFANARLPNITHNFGYVRVSKGLTGGNLEKLTVMRRNSVGSMQA